MKRKGRLRHNRRLEQLLKCEAPNSLGLSKRCPPSDRAAWPTAATPSPKARGFTDFIRGIYNLSHDVTVLGRCVTTYLLSAVKLLGTTESQGRSNLAPKTHLLQQTGPKWPEGHFKVVQKHRSIPKAMFLSISIFFFPSAD